MADSYKNSPFNRSIAPTGLCVAVSASATAFANGACRGIYAGSSGNITITDLGGNSVQFVSIATGVIHPIQATAITAATAGSLVIVY